MPGIVFSPIRLDDPEIITPNDGDVFGGDVVIQWSTEIGDGIYDGVGFPYLFHVQVASDINFASVVHDRHSWQNPSGFAYEDPVGVWNALPQAGLDPANVGKNCRYTISGMAVGTYFTRVRVEQFV